MKPGLPGEPLPEPDLATPTRNSNMARLLTIKGELDVVVDVAKGNLLRAQVSDHWIAPLARTTVTDAPSPVLQRWYILFEDELSTVQRAANNILSYEYLSDGNLAAAVQIAEKLLSLAENAARMTSQ